MKKKREWGNWLIDKQKVAGMLWCPYPDYDLTLYECNIKISYSKLFLKN